MSAFRVSAANNTRIQSKASSSKAIVPTCQVVISLRISRRAGTIVEARIASFMASASMCQQWLVWK
jgi:hypothetical protein